VNNFNTYFSEINYKKIFFFTFKSFTNSFDFLRNLILVINKENEETKVQQKNLNNCEKLILYWIKNSFEDIDCMIIVYLLSFLKKSEIKNKKIITNLLKLKLIEEHFEIKSMDSKKLEQIETSLTTNILKINNRINNYIQKKTITDYQAIDFANQITLMNYEIFAKIKPEELNDLSWSKSNKEKLSPNVCLFISNLNYFSKYFTKLIVTEKNIKKRVLIIKLLVQSAVYLKELNNFNGLFIIMSILHNSSVARLKKTWSFLNKKDNESFLEIYQLCSTDGNYKILRENIDNSILPCVPHLGIYLSVIKNLKF
jgi:hypothetical protein